MAVTLNTQLEQLMFSSAIPDLVLTTSDDNEAEIILRCPDMTIFSATHFPYSRRITIHDLRSVVELYMRERNLTLDEFELLAVHNGTQQTLATFKVVYLEHHFDGDIGEFLRNNFLTTQSAKLTSRLATEYLYFFAAAGEDWAYIWENQYHPRLGQTDMLLTGFLKQGTGYARFEERHRQRAYSEEELRTALESCGFGDIQVYEAFTRNTPAETAERLQFTARKE